jgi:aspartokinase/homoserine dehydrogenase 1
MAEVDFDTTNSLIQEHFAKTKSLQLITGFIGSTDKGETTTLGRGGSDYTGSILVLHSILRKSKFGQM